MHDVRTNISANDLAVVVKSDLTSFDHRGTPSSLCRHFEVVTRQRVSFASLVLALLQAGFAAVPHGKSFRFVQMSEITA